MSELKLYNDTTWLRYKYINEKLSSRKIAKICEVSKNTILTRLRKLNIEMRYQYGPKLNLYKNKKWLENKYIKTDLPTFDIAKLCNVDESTILNWLKKHDIKKEIPLYQNENWIKQKYINEKLSMSKIAKSCNINTSTLTRWLNRFSITRRNRGTWKGIKPWNKGLRGIQVAWNKGIECPEMRGKNHPNWNGGSSFKLYGIEFNNSLRNQIRHRDKNICQFCGCKENGKKLCVHHINYNKEDNDPHNLITICDSDNKRANKERYKWQLFFDVYQEIRRD